MRSNPVPSGRIGYVSQYNSLRADAVAGGNLLAHQQVGKITLPTNPSNTQTLTLDINGTNVVLTFVTSIGVTAGNVLIGASAAATALNVLNLLNQPDTTTTTGVALSSANQQLVSYLNFSLAAGGTTITPASINNTLYAPLTSFSASTTATGGGYTANTMALYIEPGICYVNGTEVYFLGGVTPTVTAPSSHPRIDVLTIDSTGTLAWTTGTENTSPVVPTYPANKLPICELYNVVSETILYDNLNQTSGQGYVLNDVRPFLGGSINLGAITTSILPATTNTYNLGSSSFEWGTVYAQTVIGNGLVLNAHFGGTGSDGALTITSGTTTISASSATYLEKNYTSISITGSATLVFSTPHAEGTLTRLRSQGGVTINTSATHAIDISAMGGAGGTGAGASSAQTVGGEGGGMLGGAGGLNTTKTTAGGTNGGGGGGGGSGSGQGSPGSFGDGTFSIGGTGGDFGLISQGSYIIFPGGGGGGGSSGGNNGASPGAGGAGGTGGGALIIECAGAYNFVTGSVIFGTAANGSAGTTANSATGGGGGGGGGGNVLVLYATLTADAGTYTLAAGSAGGSGGAGAAGVAVRAVNNYFS